MKNAGENMEIYSTYPGSIGELVQGKVNGIDVLISCPINLFTKVQLFETTKVHYGKLYKKSYRFFNNMLDLWDVTDYKYKLDFQINSQIPRGRGFASSTADLCALYKCLAIYFHKEYNQNELIKECLKIEPTDSILFKDMTLFDYKNGRIIKSIGEYMKFYILCFIGERIVETKDFNKLILPPQSSIEDLVYNIEKGIKEKDLNTIFNASTYSILRNQHRIKYEILDDIYSIKEKTGGLGLIGAHSGDLLGIVYKEKEALDESYNRVKNGETYKMLLQKNYAMHKFESIIDI